MTVPANYGTEYSTMDISTENSFNYHVTILKGN